MIITWVLGRDQMNAEAFRRRKISFHLNVTSSNFNVF